MPRKRNKIESPEKPSRAASVPGAEKPRSKRPKLTKAAAEERMKMHSVREQTKRALEDYKESLRAEVGEDELEEMQADLELMESGLKEAKPRKRRAEPEVEIKEATGEEAREILDAGRKEIRELETRIAKIEVALDDMREAHASSQEIQERIKELLELQEEKKELETGLTEQAGAVHQRSFEEALNDAKNRPELRVAALDYKELSSQRDWMEKELKKRTGKSAEELFMNPSLLGGGMSRFGRRVQNFFGRLAGTEKSTQTADDLLKHWREVNAELENLANVIQPPTGDYGVESRAKGLRSKTHEATETERALGREAARSYRRTEMPKEIGADIADSLEESHLEYGADIQMALVEASEDMQSLMHELNSLSAESLLELQPDFAQRIDAFRAELEEQQKLTREDDKIASALFQQASQDLKSLELVYNDTYEALSEQARMAGKGKSRPKSRIPTKRSTPYGSFGATAAMERRPGVEMHQEEGPKTELASEIAQEEISAYRAGKSQEINVVMKEFPNAARLWDQMNRGVAKLDPKELALLSENFGTKDVATAYVLDVAFAQMDDDQDARERVMRANEILGKFIGENLEEEKPTKKKSAEGKKQKTAGKRGRGNGNKNKKASA